MKPDVTIRNDSLLYRFYSIFHGKTPSDICQYHARLLRIFLLWIPIVLGFVFGVVVIPMIYSAIHFVNYGFSAYPEPESGIGILGLAVGKACWAVFFVVLFIMGLVKGAKNYIFRKVLKYTGLGLLATLLIWSLILVVSGQSVIDDNALHEIGLFNAFVSLFGIVAWIIGIVIVVGSAIMVALDSETFKNLYASAKEKWCAKVTIVDKDGNAVVDEKDKEEDLHAFEKMMAGE